MVLAHPERGSELSVNAELCVAEGISTEFGYPEPQILCSLYNVF